MSRSPQFRQVRRTIYALKRAFGKPVTICRTQNDTLNVSTGLQGADLVKCNIRRAVPLPANALRSFAYDLSFIAANRNFTYGGFYDHKVQLILVDWRDVASGFTVDNNCYLIVDDKRVEVKTFFEYESEEALVFATDGLRNAVKLDQVDFDVSNDLGLGQSVGDS